MPEPASDDLDGDAGVDELGCRRPAWPAVTRRFVGGHVTLPAVGEWEFGSDMVALLTVAADRFQRPVDTTERVEDTTDNVVSGPPEPGLKLSG